VRRDLRVVHATLIAAVVWSQACVNPAASTDPVDPCLGHIALCDRAYDDVSYFTSHNAMSSEADGWHLPNHLVPVLEQLELGVRALMLDVHLEGEVVMLCHGLCLAGMRPLEELLTTLRSYLDEHPREVLTLIFESYVPSEQVALVFESVGLDSYAHVQGSDPSWPTLGEMIGSGTRLVVFTDDAQGGPPWMHPMWAHLVETHFHYESAAELSCDLNRGQPGHPLFILNHFLTNPFAHVSNAETLNGGELLLERARSCWTAHQQRPNFVTVDFVSIGDVMAVVTELNDTIEP